MKTEINSIVGSLTEIQKDDSLSTREKRNVMHTVKTYRARTVAKNEENEILQALQFSYLESLEKSIMLTNLEESLSVYFHDKGLQKSMLSADELLNMIMKDRENLREQCSEKKETLRCTEELILSKERIEND
jgi:SMC interacting uncharacterized protein involved in chromosome segregation